MGKVQGVKEKLHYPIYDAFLVPKDGDRNIFEKAMTDPRMIRFFVDVQNKTRLETNLQASGVLPSLNTFEARAMRVAVSQIDCQNNPGVTESEVLTDLIYNSVTALLVGEKTMIEMPTFFFPSGAGVNPGNGAANHGEPDPMATFRFAEPVIIEPQQNFRVEMLFPQGVPGQDKNPAERLAGVKGPLRIWVVLDGYLTRDVQ
ncbi:MAG: hypothetical protein N2235_18630 [Fischerella sp.]|nr:hypothetical protein [Fischerella sp.]